jgi:DNA-directed RNA polymerase subunit B'
MTDIYLNEKYIGNTDKPEEFVKDVKEKRKSGKIPTTVSLNYDNEFNEIYLDTTKGRATRLLIKVEDGKKLLTKEHIDKLISNELTWESLVKDDIIEYIDAAEEENALVALYEDEITKDHTHLELSPVIILGMAASLVPYSNFGSSSRLIRGNKIQKQSIGLYASNFHMRTDTDISILHYPQRPLVKTFMHDVIDYDHHIAGQNIVIAVMSYEGYNMEDAIVINRGSVERGFARSTYFRPYETEELRYPGGLVDEVAIPDKDVKGYKSENDYKLLEDDGIVYTGATVNSEDVIAGKTSPPRFLGELEEFSITASTRRETSSTIKHGENGIVDTVIITENEEGNKIIKIKIRDQRIPELGDKFASRHGQKGVVGLIVPQENMPFTSSGVTPDILFGPSGIPSRMTISHLLEIISGKVSALSGKQIDATSFDITPEADMRKMLEEFGFREDGTEVMYNGVTGEQYKSRIFIGNMYYLKLKYMAANKLHARGFGRVQLLTRQPIEGRGKGGGLRLGEMEKDCLVAHGASLLLKERFDSDKTVLPISEKSGLIAIDDARKNTQICPIYGENVEINYIEMSYAFKLLLDELKSLCIYPRLILKSKY